MDIIKDTGLNNYSWSYRLKRDKELIVNKDVLMFLPQEVIYLPFIGTYYKSNNVKLILY